MRVLAIDTTTPRGSVAVTTEEEVLGEIRLTVPDSHSARVLPAAVFLLDGLGLSASDVEGYAIAVGPGSFTGLRVGIATIQGLALASARPCLGVPTLDVLARRLCGSGVAAIVAMMDAYRDEVFAAVYDADARLVGEHVVSPPATFLEDAPEEAAYIGDGAIKYRDMVRAARPRASFPARSLFLAGTLGRMAAQRLAAGEGVAPEELRPLYLREADVRKPRS